MSQGVPVDLSNWQVVQYQLNSQPDSNWALQPGNTSVLQEVNSDASIFLSDFDAAGQEIEGTWGVQTGSDDDFMGFVFGYQDRGHYYLFDWKQSSQTSNGKFAEVGMSLKVVNMPVAGMDPGFDDFWPSAGSQNVTVLRHNTIPWSDFVDYDFVLSFTPGTIEIDVLEAGVILDQWTVNDSTYTSGEFGFYNFSQDDVLYQGFTSQGVPEVYCDAKVNSLGCTPSIAFSGFASVSDTTPFNISASQVVNQSFGTLMYGFGGRDSVQFMAGTLCIMGALEHTGVQSTGGNSGAPDCSGTLSLDFNALLQGGGVAGAIVGDQINGQYFYRDVANPDGTGFGLTDGVEFFLLP